MKQAQALVLYDTGKVERTEAYSSYSQTLAFPTNREDLIGQALPAQRLLVNGPSLI